MYCVLNSESLLREVPLYTNIKSIEFKTTVVTGAGHSKVKSDVSDESLWRDLMLLLLHY